MVYGTFTLHDAARTSADANTIVNAKGTRGVEKSHD